MLCSDKTGTLTENRLAVTDPWCAPGIDLDELLTTVALASRAEDRDRSTWRFSPRWAIERKHRRRARR